MNKPELLAPAGGPEALYSTARTRCIWEETDTGCEPRRGISTGNRCGRVLPMRMRMESECT